MENVNNFTLIVETVETPVKDWKKIRTAVKTQPFPFLVYLFYDILAKSFRSSFLISTSLLIILIFFNFRSRNIDSNNAGSNYESIILSLSCGQYKDVATSTKLHAASG